MFHFLKRMLNGENQFAAGGLMLMIVGALSVWLRSLPERLWHWIVGQFTMIVTVKDDDAAFVWVKEWFLEQKFLKRVRRIDLDTTLRSEQIAMIPAPGKHWFLYQGRPFEVWFSRTEGGHEWNKKRIESLTFRTPGRKRAILQHFVEDIQASHIRRQGVQSYLYTYDEGWDYVQGYAPRLLDSVVLEPGEKEHLLEDIQQFRKSRLRYQNLGIPYHRGYLFYGPPGTGKTSLISALAAHFGMSVYTINLTDFNDRTLMKAINDVPAYSVLLFEDIDCMQGSQSRKRTNPDKIQKSMASAQERDSLQLGVTLSGLLNVLDGFFAPTGVLYMVTTNDVGKLDEALLRPGRIDYKLYLGKASDHQKMELYRRFFPESSQIEAREFVEASRSAETMAEFQGRLLALNDGRLDPVTISHEIPT